MDLEKLTNIYLIGIGGIGMSALARYFKQQGLNVSGYDRTESELTRKLVSEGMTITYDADRSQVDEKADLVIYTPAVPKQNQILEWYTTNNYPVLKRSEVLQKITEGKRCIAVAGSHGKTTITTMVAHLLRSSGVGSFAFLGGISVNYQTNYWKEGNANIVVVEADEYDRSFLKLSPEIAVVTAMDADHLDIYGNVEALRQAFFEYVRKVRQGGCLWYKHGLPSNQFQTSKKYAYSLQNDAADAWAAQIMVKDGGYSFDYQNKNGQTIEKINLNLGGMHNVENAVAAISIAFTLGLEASPIKAAIESFRGVKRRFEYVIKTKKVVYIDDYAHHPKELEALIKSAKRLFPERKCVIAFQPHLYTRTRDLADGFAESLSMADEVILLPIYPAREQPIQGVTSELIQSKMTQKVCTVLSKEGLLKFVKEAPLGLLITAGAGDIDRLVTPIKDILIKKESEK